MCAGESDDSESAADVRGARRKRARDVACGAARAWRFIVAMTHGMSSGRRARPMAQLRLHGAMGLAVA